MLVLLGQSDPEIVGVGVYFHARLHPGRVLRPVQLPRLPHQRRRRRAAHVRGPGITRADGRCEPFSTTPSLGRAASPASTPATEPSATSSPSRSVPAPRRERGTRDRSAAASARLSSRRRTGRGRFTDCSGELSPQSRCALGDEMNEAPHRPDGARRDAGALPVAEILLRAPIKATPFVRDSGQRFSTRTVSDHDERRGPQSGRSVRRRAVSARPPAAVRHSRSE